MKRIPTIEGPVTLSVSPEVRDKLKLHCAAKKILMRKLVEELILKEVRKSGN